MFTREIGRVIGVDSFRIIIELNEDIKGSQKSGYHDIYEVAKLNSYVILPVGNDRIVAIITRVKTFEESELEKITGGIKFPKSARHLVATMLGTITNENYVEGVYNYPILDNPVWYTIKDDLDKIFDNNEKKTDEGINFEKDYYLPIGKASNFFDFDIKINPDKFFAKHGAVLGNTGSGKSCTITSILQSLFNFDYSKNASSEFLQSANIIIFDTNGEYKNAFKGMDNINSFTISEDGLKVPYWFMNYEDFEYLFEPSEGTQAPILKSALSSAKGSNTTPVQTSINIISRPYLNKLNTLLVCLEKNDKTLKEFLIDDFENFNCNFKIVNACYSKIIDALDKIDDMRKTGNFKYEYGAKGLVKNDVVDEVYSILQSEIEEYHNLFDKSKKSNLDSPKYFNFNDLVFRLLDETIEEFAGTGNAKYKEYISSLKLRLSSFYSDSRKSEPLLLKSEDILNSLPIFLNYLFGNPLESGDIDIFSKYRNNSNIIKDKKSQITIIDLSLLPYELLETITALIGRLILEFSQRINKVEEYKGKRGEMPIVMILEEAQNYIPEIDYNGKKSIAKRTFERIAREGRKFGLSLIVSSQRPSELSKTILSQCNSFIVHRLQNPEDQKYIKQIVSSANSDLLNLLPVLPQQHAIIMGEAVRSPVQLKINDIKTKPDSSNPKYIKQWLKKENDIDINKVVEEWV